LAECTHASYHDTMTSHANQPSGFKRQVVFRVSTDDSPLLEQATHQHGSIQAALIAALHALTNQQPPAAPTQEETSSAVQAVGDEAVREPDQEITAREAAHILGLKPDSVRGYIRSGRLTGYYRDTLGSSSWMTTRGAVEDYRRDVQGKR
jgi:hypothetical protein